LSCLHGSGYGDGSFPGELRILERKGGFGPFSLYFSKRKGYKKVMKLFNQDARYTDEALELLAAFAPLVSEVMETHYKTGLTIRQAMALASITIHPEAQVLVDSKGYDKLEVHWIWLEAVSDYGYERILTGNSGRVW
jgi:hypothetical protein